MAPRVSSPCREPRSARRLVAMRVPPKRSSTAALASVDRHVAPSRWASIGVSRVSEVAKANTSASAACDRRPHEVEVGGRRGPASTGSRRTAPPGGAGRSTRRRRTQLDRLPVGAAGPGDRLPEDRSAVPDGWRTARRVRRRGHVAEGRLQPGARVEPASRGRAARRAVGRIAARSLGSRSGTSGRRLRRRRRRSIARRAASPTAARRPRRPRRRAPWAGTWSWSSSRPAAATAGRATSADDVGVVEDGGEHGVEGGEVGPVADERRPGQPVEAVAVRRAGTPTAPA